MEPTETELTIQDALRLSKQHLQFLIPDASFEELANDVSLTFILEEMVSSTLNTAAIYEALKEGKEGEVVEWLDYLFGAAEDLERIVNARNEYFHIVMWGDKKDD